MTTNLPFVLRGATSSGHSEDQRVTDLLTSEDPLPERLEIKEGNLVFALDTRMTRVSRETTDDN